MPNKKRLSCERSWYGTKGIRYFLQKEYEVIFDLSNKYSVNSLCIEMNINRSDFYKWLNRRNNPSNREINKSNALYMNLFNNELISLSNKKR